MQYMGSKNRIAKHLLPIMLEARNDRTWVEPFVGGANMIDKVGGERIGSDTHKHLISLHKALQNGWIPPTDVSKEMYYEIKKNQDKYSNELIGFVGFLCSFGGKWWGGYAADKKGTNFADRGSRVLTKQAKKLNGIVFKNVSYQDLEIPPNSLIYCDPPYEGTTKYKDGLNHTEFWDWCRNKSKEGHTVFVSEYNAPVDFDCLKEVEHETILAKNSQYKRIEKLFIAP
jgi:DNA adenine methylase